MRLLLISPTYILERGRLYHRSKRWLVGLTLPYLAALTPPGCDVRIVDEGLDPIDLDAPYDLVGISFMSHQATRAYQIADGFRTRGVPVVAGGFHASAVSEEALAHCDAVVVGEAENVWVDLLGDARAGHLRPVYRATALHDMKELPAPRFDLLDLDRYRMPGAPLRLPLQTSRGCPFDCRFCEVTKFYGRTYRFRPVAEVVREIERLGWRFLYFVDDNIAANRRRARELFRALRPLNVDWTGLINASIGKDVELLDLMMESGCRHVNIGIESINSAGLAEMNKLMNKVEDYRLVLRNLRERNIFFSVNLILGLDSDTLEGFEETVAFLRQERVPLAFMFILTPRVGTALREDLEREGRILHRDWTQYGGWNCVYQPVGLSPKELEAAFWRTLQKFYSPASIIQRLVPSFLNPRDWLVALASNLFFASGVRRGKTPTLYY